MESKKCIECGEELQEDRKEFERCEECASTYLPLKEEN